MVVYNMHVEAREQLCGVSYLLSPSDGFWEVISSYLLVLQKCFLTKAFARLLAFHSFICKRGTSFHQYVLDERMNESRDYHTHQLCLYLYLSILHFCHFSIFKENPKFHHCPWNRITLIEKWKLHFVHIVC